MEDESADLTARNEVVSSIIDALVQGDFEGVIAAAQSSRIGARDMKLAVANYGRTLVRPPLGWLEEIDYVRIQAAEPVAWSVVAPLFTAQEGESDLSLELTLVASSEGRYEARIDDIHVL